MLGETKTNQCNGGCGLECICNLDITKLDEFQFTNNEDKDESTVFDASQNDDDEEDEITAGH